MHFCIEKIHYDSSDDPKYTTSIFMAENVVYKSPVTRGMVWSMMFTDLSQVPRRADMC